MGNPNRGREKKRKGKDRRRFRQSVSLAYTGNKFKTKELVQVHLRAELGIYETFVMTDRELTDRIVHSALEKLILRMRKGPQPPVEEEESVRHVEGEEDELVISNLRRNWQDLFETEPRPSRDTLVGVLRTILRSVELWKSASPTSRGYLRHIEGFLTKSLGVSVKKYSPGHTPQPEPEESRLLVIGRRWCRDADQQAAVEFRELAEHMMTSGQADETIEVCQQLIGEACDLEVTSTLSVLSLKARESLRIAMG